MNDSIFRFKHFCCRHSHSSMKIGVDAVLIGAWADVSGLRILDVGTGCGVIALMCAQRNPDAEIFAVDIDNDSVDEAAYNFSVSPWASRLKVFLENYNDISLKNIDLIISNPPFYDAGISNPDSPRLIARHQGLLSPERLFLKGKELLSENGRIAVIVPYGQYKKLVSYALKHEMYLNRICFVKGHSDAPVKRALLEFIKIPLDVIPHFEEIVLEDINRNPTEQYIGLCKDFYLKF